MKCNHDKNQELQKLQGWYNILANTNLNPWVGEQASQQRQMQRKWLPASQVTYTQAPAVCERNIFHLLFHSARENNPL